MKWFEILKDEGTQDIGDEILWALGGKDFKLRVILFLCLKAVSRSLNVND